MGAILQPGSHAIRARRKGVIVGTAKQWVEEILRYYTDLKMDSFFFWPVMGDEEVQAKIFVEEVVTGGWSTLVLSLLIMSIVSFLVFLLLIAFGPTCLFL